METEVQKQRRLVRNEKARRKRALAYACRYLPIELEREVFSYMKNPNNGRIEVLMSFQKAPSAKLFGAAPKVLRAWHDGSFSYITEQHENWHEESYITHLAQMLAKYPHGDTLRQCKLKFTPRMQLTIARKAFDIAYRDIVSFDFKIMPCSLHYQRKVAILKLEGLIKFCDWGNRLFGCATWLRPEDVSREIQHSFYQFFLKKGSFIMMVCELRNTSNPEVALQNLKMTLQDLR